MSMYRMPNKACELLVIVERMCKMRHVERKNSISAFSVEKL
jgi:hypothetical protein